MPFLTEEEAKTRMCCASPASGLVSNHVNSRCVAGDCMAWRWGMAAQARKAARRSRMDVEGPPDKTGDWKRVASEDGWTAWEREDAPARPPRGYCGLAGIPNGDVIL